MELEEALKVPEIDIWTMVGSQSGEVVTILEHKGERTLLHGAYTPQQLKQALKRIKAMN